MAEKNGQRAHNERIDIEIVVGQSAVSLTLTGIEVGCAEEILTAVVKNLLNEHQRDVRQERLALKA